ncbi:carbohydrate ABC transporter permease [Jiangella sp. DSM 45060]|uniref:carbohydrate ABC transporter permease n=1 Tax=Jiangella sp. DSM 45060 TaxID=1798224 RepID=UPI00087C260A|nr:carbohydrate ABC transporter permease [Jiangella sp. DSM 45060]SDT57205.1 carbohydrate ABC transporter membrane protein 2, CUT1 family [Jiangella sp. DSM 45060]
MAADQTTAAPPVARRPRPRRAGALWPHAVAGLCLAALLYPVLWLILTSFKPTSEIIAGASFWPRTWTLDNFVQGWDGAGVESFGTFFLNSAIIATAAVVGNVVSCTLAAYAFGRLAFRGRAALFAVVIAILFLPKEVLLIPQYTIFHQLGWTDSFLPLIVPQFLALDAFFVFLSVQFLRGLPRELDEAAVLDGCGPWRRLWHVTLPLIRPAIATTAIFTFIWTWNDYMPQLIYLNSPENYTLSVGLRMFLDATSGSELGPMSAMSLLSLLPLFVLFVVFQRRLVKGITMTGLK